MPSITTHYLLAKEVFHTLNDEEKSKFKDSLSIYYTFSQSHDYLYYYTFNIKNFKRIRNLGTTGHHNNTQDYLLNIIKEIKNNNLENNQDAIAYLYGSITHYVLDSTAHPFIFYKTGVYRKNDKKYHKYHGMHTLMEKSIDAIYYQKYFNKTYNHCNIVKEIIGKPKFTKELTSLINNVYYNTYQEKNIGKYYYQSIIHTKIITALFFQDYLGIKKFFYKLIDFISNHSFGILSAYSTHNLKPNKAFLNEEHHTWNHPSIKDLTFNYSFEDLFNQSIKKSLKIIKEVNKVLYEDKEINYLLKYIPNIDYSTGLDIKHNIKMDYFEESKN